jgi:hypothetical protein
MVNKNKRWEEPITLYGRKMRIQLINSTCDSDQWQIVGDTPFKGEMVYLSKDWGQCADRWGWEAKTHLKNYVR